MRNSSDPEVGARLHKPAKGGSDRQRQPPSLAVCPESLVPGAQALPGPPLSLTPWLGAALLAGCPRPREAACIGCCFRGSRDAEEAIHHGGFGAAKKEGLRVYAMAGGHP